MINRSFMPRARPMTKWPDEDRASVRELCAPLSATLESSRADPHASMGHALSMFCHKVNAEKARLRNLRPKGTRGKHE